MADTKQEKKLRDTYKPTEQEAAIIRQAYERFYAARDSKMRKDAEKEWDEGMRAWDQIQKGDEALEEWQADYFVPLTTAVVEGAIDEMADQAPQPIIMPLSNEDKPRATVMRHTFEFTWETADGDMELEDIFKDALIGGDGFAQEYYWKDRRLVRSLAGVEKKNGRRLEKYTETEVFEYDDCYMECVPPQDLYFDPVARSINRGPHKARYVVRRYIMKMDDFKRFFSGDVWNPLDNVKYVTPGGDTNYYSEYKPPEDMNKTDEVEVLWYWSRSPEDALNIVANDVLIKAGPNPYRHKWLPFAKTHDIKRPHSFYNKGEAKLLKSIQKEANIMRRMITDRNHLDIDKMWLQGRNESYSEDDPITRPHGIIRVDDPANYKPIEYGDIPQSVIYTTQEINKDVVRVTRMNDRVSAASTPITATDAAIKKEEMIKAIKSKLRRAEKGFLVDIGRMRVANILQFYSQPKLEKIVGEAGSEEFHRQIVELQKQGLLTRTEDGLFKKSYRNIRVENKELLPNERGIITERPYNGFSFFDLKPEYFIPIARGGFQIRFAAGSTMPPSKSLMVKQTQDAVGALMPLATAGVGYDPVKLGDELLRSLDKDPADYHIENEEKDVKDARDEIVINLASQENDEVAKGRPIPAMGTPYATPAHTRIHIAYMRSAVAKGLPEAQYRALVKHAMGEITAQSMRGEVASLTGQAPPDAPNAKPGATQPSAGSSPSADKAMMPNLMRGGEETNGTQKGSIMTRVFGMLGRKR